MNEQWCKQRNRQLFDSERPVALVTGSSSDRVGRRIAQLLLDCQFRVAFHGHRSSQEQASFQQEQSHAGYETLLVTGEVQDTSNAEAWLTKIVEHWGRVDLLVNSAAIWEPETLENTSVDLLRQHWEVNVLGSFLLSQRFGLQMVRQASGGAIIHIGDWSTVRPYAGFSAYFLSKGSIETMTRTLAVELGSRNPRIRVNSVLPGPVLMADGIDEGRQQRIAQDCLLKRAGSASDVAEAVYFLATSPFITGVCLPVDGGRTIYRSSGLDSVAHPRTGM